MQVGNEPNACKKVAVSIKYKLTFVVKELDFFLNCQENHLALFFLKYF